jgi:hypothetical protein
VASLDFVKGDRLSAFRSSGIQLGYRFGVDGLLVPAVIAKKPEVA